MKDCVLVLGLPRSGTSVLAGIVHNLGIPMAKNNEFVTTTEVNPTGYFEDQHFTTLHCQIVGHTTMHYLFHADVGPAQLDWVRRGYKSLVQSRNELYDRWGVKDPRLMIFMRSFCKVINRPLKVLIIDRPLEQVEKSINAYPNNLSAEIADLPGTLRKWLDIRKQARQVVESLPDSQIMDVTYRQIVSDPHRTVKAIADYLQIQPTREAIELIRPDLDHWGQQ